jgi:hypothetical protein
MFSIFHWHCVISYVILDEYIRNQVKALNKESKSMGSLKWSTAVMKKVI